MACAPSMDVTGSGALAGLGISGLHWWEAPKVFMIRVRKGMALGPKRLWTRWPLRKARRMTGSTVAKLRATDRAIFWARRLWLARRKRLVSWPVSLPTGQAVAHRPSVAQVSRAM